MNERIKELALQAKLGSALLLHHFGTIDALTDSEQEDLEQLEKFAELLVLECVNAVMDGTKEGDNYAMRIEQHFDDKQGGILHFGVEEPKGWVCSKCGVDRTKAVCPKGHSAALTGGCPMIGEAQ